ncbi:MAG: PKD domain-containing protein [Paludibacter sp.]
MKNLLLLFATILLFNGCEDSPKNIESKDPIANFSTSSINIFTKSITLINTSQYSNNYIWDFGDGTTSTSVQPTHSYSSYGKYTVKLISSNGIKSDSISKIINLDDVVNENLNLTSIGANLDVDNDAVVDFHIFIFSYSGTSGQRYCAIEIYNNYEIFSDSTDEVIVDHYVSSIKKVCVPKIYILRDKIQNSTKTENKSISVCGSFYGMSGGSSFSNWIKDEIRYIGFRKVYGNYTKIGWIKLKVLDYTDVTLISYKIPIESESLLIDK